MLRANREWACLIASILIGLSCNRMQAQMTTGSMAGTVVDASDAVIPGAEVSRSITLSLSKANHDWSNSPERSGLRLIRFFSRDRGIGVKA